MSRSHQRAPCKARLVASFMFCPKYFLWILYIPQGFGFCPQHHAGDVGQHQKKDGFVGRCSTGSSWVGFRCLLRCGTVCSAFPHHIRDGRGLVASKGSPQDLTDHIWCAGKYLYFLYYQVPESSMTWQHPRALFRQAAQFIQFSFSLAIGLMKGSPSELRPYTGGIVGAQEDTNSSCVCSRHF